MYNFKNGLTSDEIVLLKIAIENHKENHCNKWIDYYTELCKRSSDPIELELFEGCIERYQYDLRVFDNILSKIEWIK